MKYIMEYILITVSIAVLIHSIGYLPLRITYFTLGTLTGFTILFIGINRIIRKVREGEDRSINR